MVRGGGGKMKIKITPNYTFTTPGSGERLGVRYIKSYDVEIPTEAITLARQVATAIIKYVNWGKGPYVK